MIHQAAASEALAIAALAAQMWHHSIDELADDFTDTINSADGAVYVASEDGTLVGFAQCQLRRDYVEGTASSPVGYLEGIYVREEYRGRGIARALLARCEIWAREQGCTEFASDCELTNDDSLRFHLKLGFAEANRIICFTKRL